MPVTNSMNKARQCFEARGISARTAEDTRRQDLPTVSDNRREDGNRQQAARVAKVFASKSTDLPGAIIYACGAGMSLWGVGVASGMIHREANNALCLETEKSEYNGSGRWR